jgi:DNA-directed RNA polymerase specialized sigma24 family protein
MEKAWAAIKVATESKQTSRVHDMSAMNEKSEIDRVADSAALLARKIRSLRAEIAEIAEQGDHIHGQGNDPIDDALDKIASSESELEDHLVRLQPIIIRKAEAVARAKRIAGQDAEHLAGNAITHIGTKIDRFSCEKQGQSQGDASAFEAWISTVIERLAIDYFRRRPRTGVEVTEQHLEWNSHRCKVLTDAAERQVPQAFLSDEERTLDDMPAERRHLFLYMTGLWQLVSDEQQELWREFPAPSEWELNELNARQRASRFALALAEKQFALLVQQQPELTDADFDGILNKIEQRSAHNLRRHFWVILKLDTAWTYLFRRIPALSGTVLDELDKSINARSLVPWLVLDLWLGCDNAQRWFCWLARVRAVHALDCNLGILMNLPILEEGHSRWNQRKVDLACRFVGYDPKDIDDPMAMLQVSTHHEGQLFDRARQIQQGKRHLDVCLSYRTVREMPLQMVPSDSENAP